jgi:hypothetical protein
MGTRADFYIDNMGDMTWLGSIYRDGQPWNIPIVLLAQVNPAMFAEQLDEYFETVDNADHKWPWPWEDSQLTDYSYILDCEQGKVVGYTMQDKMIFDPLKVSVGEDLSRSKIANAVPNFPKLGVGYGQKSSKTLQGIRKLFKLPKFSLRS